jgi:peptide/nickel transport system permease protein
MTDTHIVDQMGIPEPLTPEQVASTPLRPTRRALSKLWHNKVAMFALFYIALMIFVAIFTHLLTPQDPANQDAKKFLPASGAHLLGTDQLGRDILSRLIDGTTVTVKSGFITIAFAALIAVPLGLLAAYVGGAFDNFIMRVMDALNAFPALVLALAIAAILGPSLEHAMIAITIVLIPGLVRITRAQSLAVRQETFVEASRAIGTRTHTVLWKRILPGVATALIVAITIAMGGALLAESALSFLGLGVQPPNASWGSMLRDGFAYVYTEPLMIVYPGVLLALAILSFNLLGDSVNDALGQGHRVPKRRKQKRAEKAQAKERRGRLGLTSATSAAQPTAVPAPDAILEVQDLKVEFDTDGGPLTVIDGVNFTVSPGEVLGLVGESGCGKSVTSLAIMRLIPSPPGRITGGAVFFEGRNVLDMGFDEMRELRGNHLSMVFQDPMSSLDPCFQIGHQLVEAIRLHRGVPGKKAEQRALELLDLVGIPDARSRMSEYPHRLSGGTRQRVMIAMALINDPKFLIADEPTTALDVTIQAQILELLKRLQSEIGMSMIFVTHDLGVVADICDRVVVMYAGQIAEEAKVHDLYAQPLHPYTEALMGAIPRADETAERLVTIPGVVPTPDKWPIGCRFAERCTYAIPECRAAPIELLPFNGNARLTRCIRTAQIVEKRRSGVKTR